MPQVNIPDGLVNELKIIMDSHPTYKDLGLYHRSDYVKEALKDFVKCRCEPMRSVLKDEIDRVLKQIVKVQVAH